MSHECELCKARGKTWKGDDPRCAFDDAGNFVQDNWCCATMGVLRAACDNPKEGAATYSSDHWIGVLPVPDALDDLLPEGAHPVTHVVINWYKSRGQTPTALTFSSEYQALPIHEALAVEMAKRILGRNQR